MGEAGKQAIPLWWVQQYSHARVTCKQIYRQDRDSEKAFQRRGQSRDFHVSSCVRAYSGPQNVVISGAF